MKIHFDASKVWIFAPYITIPFYQFWRENSSFIRLNVNFQGNIWILVRKLKSEKKWGFSNSVQNNNGQINRVVFNSFAGLADHLFVRLWPIILANNDLPSHSISISNSVQKLKQLKDFYEQFRNAKRKSGKTFTIFSRVFSEVFPEPKLIFFVPL